MGVVAKDSGGDFEPIPVGLHRALCINVFDVGYQPGFQNNPPAHKVVVLWEIEPLNSKGKHFTVTKIYTLSIGDKSNLGADLTSWRGKPFTEEEKDGFDLDKIKGKACQLNLVSSGDRVKISTVLPAFREIDPATRASVISMHWLPDTDIAFVPNFVQKMATKQQPVVKNGVEAATPVAYQAPAVNQQPVVKIGVEAAPPFAKQSPASSAPEQAEIF